jgi:hypothetical protein
MTSNKTALILAAMTERRLARIVARLRPTSSWLTVVPAAPSARARRVCGATHEPDHARAQSPCRTRHRSAQELAHPARHCRRRCHLAETVNAVSFLHNLQLDELRDSS